MNTRPGLTALECYTIAVFALLGMMTIGFPLFYVPQRCIIAYMRHYEKGRAQELRKAESRIPVPEQKPRKASALEETLRQVARTHGLD